MTDVGEQKFNSTLQWIYIFDFYDRYGESFLNFFNCLLISGVETYFFEYVKNYDLIWKCFMNKNYFAQRLSYESNFQLGKLLAPKLSWWWALMFSQWKNIFQYELRTRVHCASIFAQNISVQHKRENLTEKSGLKHNYVKCTITLSLFT